MKKKVVGIFDSGLGGLTVLKTLNDKLPDTDFIYIGDTARLPYGTKSRETIARYTRQAIQALLPYEPDAIVVACNTASTALLSLGSAPALISASDFQVPVINVIEPGAEYAAKTTQSKRVGVLATRTTVHSDAYRMCIQKLDPEILVYSQAAPLLVPLVEEGWEDDPITNLVVFRYLSVLLQNNIDTLVLGCTHYPALHASFARVCGQSIQRVDSGYPVAEKLSNLLGQSLNREPEQEQSSGLENIKFFATDVAMSVNTAAKRILGVSQNTPLEFTGIDL